MTEHEELMQILLGGGKRATHKMSWAEVDGKYIVFPTVLYDWKRLVDYGNAALDNVLKTGNFIEFDSPEKADWFSRRYKTVWGTMQSGEGE